MAKYLPAVILCILIPVCGAAQQRTAKSDLDDSIRSCQIVEFTLQARGKGEDIPTDDDFALAGKGCKQLQIAVSKSDNAMIQSELAALRKLFARLGMAPSTPEEQLAATETNAAKLSGRELFYELSDLAKRALAVGDAEKAGKYAKRLIEMAPQYREDWNYGNAIFHGNVVLGRIALRRGDIKQASDNLLAAGATPGSPQLDSFGPNMSLAKELLEHGEPDVVLEFFDLCKKFWTLDRGQLDEWGTEVRHGKVPDFGSNLRY